MEAVSVSQRPVALFGSHRIECVVHGEWVAPTGQLLAARVTWYAGEKTEWLDVDVLLEGERQLQEAFAGIGSGGGGLQDALRSFASSPFHVPLSVLQGQVEEDQVMVETWEIDERYFEVYIGNLNLRGAEGRVPSLSTGLLLSTERTIRAEPLDTRLHWFRYSLCTFGNQRTVGALFDNQPQEAGIQSLAALDWQDSQGYYSVRSFLTLKPLAQAAVLRNPQDVDDGSIPARSPLDGFDPYHAASTVAILRSLVDGTMQMSLFVSKRRHDFQMRRARD